MYPAYCEKHIMTAMGKACIGNSGHGLKIEEAGSRVRVN